MNTHRQTRLQALLERISFGAVPVDGFYWLDPKDVQLAQAKTASSRGPAAAVVVARESGACPRIGATEL